MATIRYNITAGIAPFTVTITPAVHAPQNHSVLGNYFFSNIPDNNYTIEVTDSVGCNISFNVSVQCNTTTTTTILPTTTTTEEPTTTTTTILEPETEYGYLYNWYAATDTRDITANGWRIPTTSDAKILADYLGASSDYVTNEIGYKLLETGTTHWEAPNEYATNEVNFNFRGGGHRYVGDVPPISDGFAGIKLFGSFYLSDLDKNAATFLTSVYKIFWINETGSELEKRTGLSLRPVKDSTTLSDGETGTYKGNDGKVYPTICIGTQEWLAANLEETKFRDGTDIPYIDNVDAGDDALWAAATSAAYCIYPIT